MWAEEVAWSGRDSGQSGYFISTRRGRDSVDGHLAWKTLKSDGSFSVQPRQAGDLQTNKLEDKNPCIYNN